LVAPLAQFVGRGGAAANIAASALLLTFGLGLVANHPQRFPNRSRKSATKQVEIPAIRQPDSDGNLGFASFTLRRKVLCDIVCQESVALEETRIQPIPGTQPSV
jgi:hypothetical protein